MHLKMKGCFYVFSLFYVFLTPDEVKQFQNNKRNDEEYIFDLATGSLNHYSTLFNLWYLLYYITVLVAWIEVIQEAN